MVSIAAQRRPSPAPSGLPNASLLRLIPLGQCLDYLGETRVTRGWLHTLVRRGDIPSTRTLQLPGKRPIVLVDPEAVRGYFSAHPPKK